MTVLTFREDLYDREAILEAAKAYAEVAAIEIDVQHEGGLHRVSLTATGRFQEMVVALEFQNFALGATIDRLRSSRDRSP